HCSHDYATPRDLLSFPTRRSSDLEDRIVEDRAAGDIDDADQHQGEDAQGCDKGKEALDRDQEAVQPVDQAAARGRLARCPPDRPDRKSTRLNSSHVKISYAVFCLK